MKKIIGFVVLLLFICSESFAASWKTGWRLQKGDTVSGEFKVFPKHSITLPEGEFTVVLKYGELVGWGIATEGLTLAQFNEDNVPFWSPIFLDKGELTFDTSGTLVSPVGVASLKSATVTGETIGINYANSTQFNSPFAVLNSSQKKL